jgi:ribose transport system ATP-binding protein
VTDLVLHMSDIKKHFGGIQALKGVDFSLKEGEIHALLGENGAGKSTLVKIITGVHQADGGSISLFGSPTVIDNPIDARRKGIGVIYQELSLIDSITVGENIFLGNEHDLISRSGLYNRRQLYERSKEYLDKFAIEIDPRDTVSNLRMGQKRIIEIVKALALDAKILLFDEPTTGMSQSEINTLFQIMDLLRQRKVTMIYISHYLEEVFRICDRATVFRDGKNVQTFEIATTSSEDLVKAMIGREIQQQKIVTIKDLTDASLELELDNFRTNLMKAPVSLKLRRGEILGVTGIIGAGKSELAHSIFGSANSYSGELKLSGATKKIHSSIAAKKNGIAFIPEDRKSEGLFLGSTIAQNFMIVNIEKSTESSGLLNMKKVRDFTLAMGRKLSINPLEPDMTVGNLSGGNQQKVVIGKWLVGEPRIILMDEPTRGIDVGAKSEIYGHIRALAAQGKAIMVLSSEYQELMDLCDRILVLRAGRIVGEFSASETTVEQILSLSLGVNHYEKPE